MYCIVGLGNPGESYVGTRHNIGFRVVEALATTQRTSIRRQEFQALTARSRICRTEVLIMKPQTFMNLSGRSLREAGRKLPIEPERTVVVYDDVDLPFGRLRIRVGGGSGGHRGIASIIDETGEPSFIRLRLGVGRSDPHRDMSEHVLETFSDEEEEALGGIVGRAVDALRAIVCRGVTPAMNEFNRGAEVP